MPTDVTVFIVDDDEAIRDSLSALISGEGFSVETYGSGTAFQNAYQPGRRGCLLVDVRMPGMSGLELHRALIEAGAALPVIVITGHGDVPTAVQAMKNGAADFIEKPVAPEHLLDTIRRVLEAEEREAQSEAATAELTARLERLTPRERDVLHHLVAGAVNKVIARELGISPRTVEIHRARVMEKMQADNLSQLIRMALTVGILASEPPSFNR